MKEFNGRIYLGGSNSMIEILRLGLSEAILLRREDLNYFWSVMWTFLTLSILYKNKLYVQY